MEAVEKIVYPDEITGFSREEQRFEPYSWYREMRRSHPVYFDPEQKVWNVFLYRDVERVLSDYHLFSSKNDRRLSPFPVIGEEEKSLTSMDPPSHSKRRGLVAKAFTPKSLKTWEPRIAAVAQYWLDQIREQATIDLVYDLAIPLPVTVIAELLGVPASDWKQFKLWSDAIVTPGSRDTYAESVQERTRALKEMADYLRPIIREKRSRPTDDIISDLTIAELEGERLSDEEIIHFGIGLLFAGNETTTRLISNAFYCFLVDQPAAYPLLRKEPSLIPKAVEEVLRFRSPAQFMMRRVAQDTNVFGVEMKEGESVIAWIGSANRDEEHFVQAEQFDLNRPNNQQHLSFGKGTHFCLGAPLARMEASIGLTEFMRRYSRLTLPEDWSLSENLGERGFLSKFPVRVER
ncbi:cytochrome P450 [Paenibacillus oleatilyticus]|uniref:cytochrome P450 n=1 Tax=Paenibacillus oleatilyticus TaxID=2594886 RepID=UPI001C1FB1EB|nr:cytochrome P450 [Paenibacillus oleatilyticus]MBU7314474.1 cytochrome P450 [Paenibacillus oleatilyticus]